MFNSSGSGFIDLILFAIFAVVIGAKLFNALGKKDFDEDNFGKNKSDKNQKNIINFPTATNLKPLAKDINLNSKILTSNFYKEKYGEEIAEKIIKIKSTESSFSPEEFLSGASMAFEMIIKAFAKSDIETLKNLLAKDVFDDFKNAIDERVSEKNTLEATIISIEPLEITEISLKRRNVAITVTIKSEQINLIKNSEGEIISGDKSISEESIDVWTFSRNLSSQNPNWEVVETR